MVSDTATRRNLAISLVLSKGGPDGSTTAKALRSWRLLEAEIVVAAGVSAGVFLLEQQVSEALIAKIVQSQQERASMAASGSQGGRTVGKTIREGFTFLQKVIRVPLESGRRGSNAASRRPPSDA